MKKWIGIILGIIVIIAFVVIIVYRVKLTSNNTSSPSTNSTGIETSTDNTNSDTKNSTAKSSTDGIDVDLTTLSSTMVYGEVYNMMMTPEKYIGKIIKMKGTFSVYHDDSKNKDYFACIVQDATACCSQGLEFETTEEFTYPQDFPNAGEQVCVVGVFDTYKEDNTNYVTLRKARLVN
ncbi:MAG: hypothetical protein K5644_01115 [Lachnospiraceae bacterium]|nr:hypothetical protein [Lachnospiraceae bacterium]